MDLTRQRDLLNEAQLSTVSVTLIGAGGIGSPTALVLAKMGVKYLTVYDHDVLEEHNIPNQLYPTEPIGFKKVDILAETIEQFGGYSIHTVREAYTDQSLNGIVISAVDSMTTRQAIWDQVKQQAQTISLYIEARMGAELGMVYTALPTNQRQREWYETTLYPDRDATVEPCTRRAIIYNVLCLAGLIGAQVKKFIRHESYPNEVIMDLEGMALYTHYVKEV